jgi:SAM-dependent methyltransferase
LRALLLKLRQRNPEGRHLDFACGTGRITEVTEEIFDQIDALDVSEAMVDLARKRCPKVRFFVGDVLEQPELCPGPYSSMTSFRLLLNLDSSLRLPILRALYSRLEPGGSFIANVHGNSHSLRQPAILWKRWRNPAAPRGGLMLNSMSPRETATLFEAAGFRVEERHGVGLLPPTLYRWPLRGFWMGLDRFLSRISLLESFCIDLLYVCSKKAGA